MANKYYTPKQTYEIGATVAGNLILNLRQMPVRGVSGFTQYVAFACQRCAKYTENSTQTCSRWVTLQEAWLCADCLRHRNNQKQLARKELVDTLKTADVLDIRSGIHNDHPAYFLTVACQSCNKRFEEPGRKMRTLEMTGGLFCPVCRQSKTREAVPYHKDKLSPKVLKMLNRLPQAQKRDVEKLVFEHVAACQKNETPMEPPDRIYLEAIEVVQCEARHGAATVTASLPKAEPFRRYEQYVTPKDVSI